MTFQEVLAQVRARLEQAGIPDVAVEAEVLVRYAAGLSREQLLAALRDPFPKFAAERLAPLVERRLLREPLPYIVERREFFGLDFYVDRRVLIPRQETETLLEQALALLTPEEQQRGLRVADIGTGSGVIAIGFAMNQHESTITASDISAEALEVAAINVNNHLVEPRLRRGGARLGASTRVKLVRGDLLEPVKGPVDMLLANLPYVSEEQWESLQPEIVRYEPKVALVAADGGLALVLRLLEQIASRREKPRYIVLELGVGQAVAAKAAAERLLPKATVRVYQDLARLERGLVITIPRR